MKVEDLCQLHQGWGKLPLAIRLNNPGFLRKGVHDMYAPKAEATIRTFWEYPSMYHGLYALALYLRDLWRMHDCRDLSTLLGRLDCDYFQVTSDWLITVHGHMLYCGHNAIQLPEDMTALLTIIQAHSCGWGFTSPSMCAAAARAVDWT